ncbi:MAG: hypothetical protein GEU80_10235 [Dehalococcoidia bacterium]|nr:hypothetical protein [Dehalococcoidia bacterium]
MKASLTRHAIKLYTNRASIAVFALAIAFGMFAAVNVATGGAQQPRVGEDWDQKRAKEAATYTPLTKAVITDPSQAPPPPSTSRFIDERGFFSIPPYDDRALTNERKEADPVNDPRWPAFVHCMQGHGYGTWASSPDTATQADIDRLVEEVNVSGPFYEPAGPTYTYLASPASDAFLDCESNLYFENRPTPGGS